MKIFDWIFGRRKVSKIPASKSNLNLVNRQNAARKSEDEICFDYAASLLSKNADGYSIEREESYDLNVVGESFYQSEIESICGEKTESGANLECSAILVCEKSNPKDKMAVSVKIDGKVVGHLARSHARAWRKMLAAEGAKNMDVNVGALIVGGWKRGMDEGTFGVKLDVPLD